MRLRFQNSVVRGIEDQLADFLGSHECGYKLVSFRYTTTLDTSSELRLRHQDGSLSVKTLSIPLLAASYDTRYVTSAKM